MTTTGLILSFAKMIMAAEVVWVLFFGVLVFCFQLGSDSNTVYNIYYLRDALLKMALHAGAPIGVASLLESSTVRQGGSPKWTPLAWIMLALFTDLFSVFDVWLHLTAHVDPTTAYINCLKALSMWACVCSGLSSVMYLLLLAQNMGQVPIVLVALPRRSQSFQ